MVPRRVLICVLPRRLRDRYGDEVQALLDDLEASGSLRVRDQLDVVLAGLSQRFSGARHRRLRWCGLAVALGGAAVVALLSVSAGTPGVPGSRRVHQAMLSPSLRRVPTTDVRVLPGRTPETAIWTRKALEATAKVVHWIPPGGHGGSALLRFTTLRQATQLLGRNVGTSSSPVVLVAVHRPLTATQAGNDPAQPSPWVVTVFTPTSTRLLAVLQPTAGGWPRASPPPMTAP